MEEVEILRENHRYLVYKPAILVNYGLNQTQLAKSRFRTQNISVVRLAITICELLGHSGTEAPLWRGERLKIPSLGCLTNVHSRHSILFEIIWRTNHIYLLDNWSFDWTIQFYYSVYILKVMYIALMKIISSFLKISGNSFVIISNSSLSILVKNLVSHCLINALNRKKNAKNGHA